MAACFGALRYVGQGAVACQLTVWQRCEGGWRQSATAQGGWQGSQLVQVMYAFSQEETMSTHLATFRTSHPECGHVARLAILDDQYLHASAGDLVKAWPFVLAAKAHV